MSRAGFDDELLRLRQKLSSTSGVRAPPPVTSSSLRPASTSNAAGGKGSGAGSGTNNVEAVPRNRSSSSAATVQWVADNMAQHPTSYQSSSSADHAAGAPCANLLSFLSRVPPPDRQPIAKPSSNPPENYLRRAVAEFDAACLGIEEFTYDVDEEEDRVLREQLRKGHADPSQLPRFLADPFDFRGALPAAPGDAAASGINKRYAARKAQQAIPDEADDGDRAVGFELASSSAVAPSSVSAAGVLQQQQRLEAARRDQLQQRFASPGTTGSTQRNDALYALPEAMARRHGLKSGVLEPAGRPGLDRTGSTMRGPRRSSSSTSRTPAGGVTPTPPRAPAPSSASPSSAATGGAALDFSQVQLKKFRDPAEVVTVSDGRIAFCRACHRVVIGSGVGRCPHCGHINNTDDGGSDDGEADEAVGARRTLQLTAGPGVSEAATANDGALAFEPRDLGPNPTIEEIEAEERRQFQAAVAAWRSGTGLVEADGGAAAAQRMDGGSSGSGVAFERSVARVGRDVALRSQGHRSGLYFLHLWEVAFNRGEDRS